MLFDYAKPEPPPHPDLDNYAMDFLWRTVFDFPNADDPDIRNHDACCTQNNEPEPLSLKGFTRGDVSCVLGIDSDGDQCENHTFVVGRVKDGRWFLIQDTFDYGCAEKNVVVASDLERMMMTAGSHVRRRLKLFSDWKHL